MREMKTPPADQRSRGLGIGLIKSWPCVLRVTCIDLTGRVWNEVSELLSNQHLHGAYEEMRGETYIVINSTNVRNGQGDDY